MDGRIVGIGGCTWLGNMPFKKLLLPPWNPVTPAQCLEFCFWSFAMESHFNGEGPLLSGKKHIFARPFLAFLLKWLMSKSQPESLLVWQYSITLHGPLVWFKIWEYIICTTLIDIILGPSPSTCIVQKSLQQCQHKPHSAWHSCKIKAHSCNLLSTHSRPQLEDYDKHLPFLWL